MGKYYITRYYTDIRMDNVYIYIYIYIHYSILCILSVPCPCFGTHNVLQLFMFLK